MVMRVTYSCSHQVVWCCLLGVISGCGSQPSQQSDIVNRPITAESSIREVNLHAETAGAGNDGWLKPHIAPPNFTENATLTAGCTPGKAYSIEYPDGIPVFNTTLYDQVMQSRVTLAERRHIWVFRKTQHNRQMEFIQRQIEANPALKDPKKFEQIRLEHRKFIAWKQQADEVEDAVRRYQEGQRNGFKDGFSESMKISLLAGNKRSIDQSRPRFYYDPSIHSIPDNLDIIRRNGLIIEAQDKALREQETVTSRLMLEVRAQAHQTFSERSSSPNSFQDLLIFSDALDSRMTPCFSQTQMTPENRNRLNAINSAHEQITKTITEQNRPQLLKLIAQARTSGEIDQPLRQFIHSDQLRNFIMTDPRIVEALNQRKNELYSQELQASRNAAESARIANEAKKQKEINGFRALATANQPPSTAEIDEIITAKSFDASRQNFNDIKRTGPNQFSAYSKNIFGMILYRSDYKIWNTNISCKAKESKQICEGTLHSEVKHYRLESILESEYRFPQEKWRGEFWWSDNGLMTSMSGGGFSLSQNTTQKNTSNESDAYSKKQQEIIQEGENKKRMYDEFKKLNPKAY